MSTEQAGTELSPLRELAERTLGWAQAKRTELEKKARKQRIRLRKAAKLAAENPDAEMCAAP